MSPAAAALSLIRTALSEEIRDQSHVDDLAQVLETIAYDYAVSVEELLRWIHDPQTSDITAPAWIRHCVEYVKLRTKLGL